MRRSRVLEKLRRGECVLSTQVGSAHAPFAAIAVQSGFDCVWLDMEHKALSEEQVRECILACTVYDGDTVVRIRKRGYLDYFRPLEDGAAGIMVPHCKSAAEAYEAVYNTRFQPLGQRGMDFTGLSSDYMMAPGAEAAAHANENTFLMLQIEDVEALECLDEIAAVEGVDLLFIGPADLGQSARAHGRWHEEFMEEVYQQVEKACSSRPGLWWGTVTGSGEAAARLAQKGCRFINIRGDFGAVASGMRAFFEDACTQLQRGGIRLG